MKSLLYFPSIPRYLAARALGRRYPVGWLPLRLSELPEPEPPPGWVKARVRLAGVCGSDLALLFGKNSPRLSPFFSFPAVLGHEILAELDGARVVVNPLLGCRERGLEPCAACQRGEEGLCANVAEGALAPGMIGYHKDLPGGWGEMLLAQPHKLLQVPDAVPDERAVLSEPLAVALRGLRRAFGQGSSLRLPQPLLIIGAGSIGLLSLALLRALGHNGRLDVVARRPLQKELALSLGASRVYHSSGEALKDTNAHRYKPILGAPVWRGGYSAVIEAAGSASSLDEAAWAASEGGTVLLLGAASEVKHDFSAHWFSELAWFGSYTYSNQDFADALAMLDSLAGIEALVGKTFELSDWRSAITAAREKKVVKAAFAPGGRR